MSELHEYLNTHALRGDCTCGRCFDAPLDPEQPEGHTADVIYFKVSAQNHADPVRLREVIASHKGEFNDVDLFDGKEHNYMEVGGWIGDQGLALMLIGLGSVLGLWRLLTPRSVMPGLPDDLVQQMAGVGMISLQADKEEASA